MFKRLVVLFLLVAATVSVSTPVHAATLTVTGVACYQYVRPGVAQPFYRCYAGVSGGTGSYVSYTWDIDSTHGDYTLVTTANNIDRPCSIGEYLWVYVTVTDSAGATASGWSDRVACSSVIE